MPSARREFWACSASRAMHKTMSMVSGSAPVVFATLFSSNSPGDRNPSVKERAGMNFRQILESLTTAPYERFGLSKKTGRIAPGMDADIVLLGSDPATDVKAFSTV